MPASKPTLFRRDLRRLIAARDGATVVEFAIISLPFLALFASILELGLMFMASTTIDAATEAAARQIRTGQLQAGANNTADGFKTMVCDGMSWISSSDCMANMSLGRPHLRELLGHRRHPADLGQCDRPVEIDLQRRALPATLCWCGCSIRGP